MKFVMMLAVIAAAGLLVAGCSEKPKTAGDVAKDATKMAGDVAKDATKMAGDVAKDATKTAETATDAIAQKTCPVMGGKIDPKLFVDYKGRRVYFCCDACPPMFNKEPDKYIAKLDEQLKAGATK